MQTTAKRKIISKSADTSVSLKEFFDIKSDLLAERIDSLKNEMNLKFDASKAEQKNLNKKINLIFWFFGFLTVLITIYKFIK